MRRIGRVVRTLAIVLGAGVVASTGCDAPASAGDEVVNAGVAILATRPSSEAVPDRFGVGRAAHEAEVAAWDIDIMPDGAGLPDGEGSVGEGAAIYSSSCVQCHGEDMQGTPIGDRLVPPADIPGFPDGEVTTTARSIGNYWPYATTVFDYVRRAMPFDRPGSLTDGEVYAVTGYLLWRNGIVQEDAVMNAATLSAVEMPARDRFVVDDRLESDRVR